MTFRAHSKTEYKRLVAQGANALPPNKGMKIELTPAIVECLKRGLNCWAKQNDAEGIEIKEILKLAEDEQQIKDIAKHLLELKQLVTPMMVKEKNQ